MKKKPTVIIGAGPAGFSCALGLREAHLPCLLIEKEQPGGQLNDIPSLIDNFALGCFIDGMEAVAALKRALRASEDEFLRYMKGEATDLDLNNRTLRVGGELIEAANIVLATGYRVRELTFPGSLSPRVHYHSDKLDGQHLAVIGGGDSAVLKAIGFSRHFKTVYLVIRGKTLRARPDLKQEIAALDNVKILKDCRIDTFDDKASLLSLTNGSASQTLAVDSVLIKAGYLPNTEFLQGKITLDQTNHLPVDKDCRTEIAGVFGAGDITSGNLPRIAIAVGQGMKAAATIIQDIFSQA